ncbi:LPXTG cell wall anchor domain-containing protein [Fictibacillus sp. NRS-1165]|uniref:LPXTG cell wall anchor domain-containing protein n=1 Tax=Fictibacillus sp. NRS-1165 TaxID=3144463 RepID=UPI003D1A589F
MNFQSKRFKLLMAYSLLVLTIVLFLPMGKTGADETTKEIDIALSPGSYLFDLQNLKPGDWGKRTLTIQNKGNQDFTYDMTAKRESGSRALYQQLLLKVSDSKGTLYEGSLKDFKKIEPRLLSHFDEEKLQVTLQFPYESGNEFQGKITNVVFQFQSTGHESSDPGNPDDPSQPAHPEDPGNPTDPSLPSGGLPKTGESSPLLFLVTGFFVTAAGVALLFIKYPALRRTFKRG